MLHGLDARAGYAGRYQPESTTSTSPPRTFSRAERLFRPWPHTTHQQPGRPALAFRRHLWFFRGFIRCAECGSLGRSRNHGFNHAIDRSPRVLPFHSKSITIHSVLVNNIPNLL